MGFTKLIIIKRTDYQCLIIIDLAAMPAKEDFR